MKDRLPLDEVKKTVADCKSLLRTYAYIEARDDALSQLDFAKEVHKRELDNLCKIISELRVEVYELSHRG
jgi:hypothetical protein